MDNYTNLIAPALAARDRAVAPYSRFHVGAALLTASGEIITGCNVESSSYGLSMCAERIALYKALSDGHQKFTALAIATHAERPCPPCGACRQVLWEYCNDIPVLLIADNGDIETTTLASLFPHPFDKTLLDDENE